MVNEEIARQFFNLEVRLGKATAKNIYDEIKKILQKSKQNKNLASYAAKEGSEVKLKDLVKKGQLEEIPVKDAELKELRKELNKHGVKFSVMYDKADKTYSVFIQAKDTKVMQKAFDNAVKKAERKADRKASIKQSLNKFKEMAKNAIKDKIKNKEKEQSL